MNYFVGTPVDPAKFPFEGKAHCYSIRKMLDIMRERLPNDAVLHIPSVVGYMKVARRFHDQGGRAMSVANTLGLEDLEFLKYWKPMIGDWFERREQDYLGEFELAAAALKSEGCEVHGIGCEVPPAFGKSKTYPLQVTDQFLQSLAESNGAVYIEVLNEQTVELARRFVQMGGQYITVGKETNGLYLLQLTRLMKPAATRGGWCRIEHLFVRYQSDYTPTVECGAVFEEFCRAPPKGDAEAVLSEAEAMVGEMEAFGRVGHEKHLLRGLKALLH